MESLFANLAADLRPESTTLELDYCDRCPHRMAVNNRADPHPAPECHACIKCQICGVELVTGNECGCE